MKKCLTDPSLNSSGLLNDEMLRPYADIIKQRLNYIKQREAYLTGTDHSLYEFADYHLFFGLHFKDGSWVFREWAPNAVSICIIGDMTEWQEKKAFSLSRKDSTGIWEKEFKKDVFVPGQHYKLKMYWKGGAGERLPTAAQRVVQDPDTLIFTAQVTDPDAVYHWHHTSPEQNSQDPVLIYESHVGMAQEQGRVGTFKAFEENVLPLIKQAGYNTVQFMAVQEHPFYGSFGYHVSSFFAVSSRFGTANEFKRLVDTAHGLGLRVLMDIVHSHAVNNENEGISCFDGTLDQFFYSGERGYHRLWDSRCFDYSKEMVVKFLLSNCRYFMETCHVDGFRFDGVTSMLFKHHGIEKAFTGYGDYFEKDDVDEDALAYLFMVNKLIHDIQPGSQTIAEDVSGFPGLAFPSDKGGIGFDFRFAMGISDYWIKLLKEYRDEHWPLRYLWFELNSRRSDEKSISYAECHDQALVGDQTLMMRLMGPAIYDAMGTDNKSIETFRGVALHKLIRFITLATAGSGYLNFMGNEFGHPEWIDFPGEHNHWSYHYARRQWSLMENQTLFYSKLAAFDRAMIALVKQYRVLNSEYPCLICHNEEDRVMVFTRKDLVFAFNFDSDTSFTDYRIGTGQGNFKMIFNTDDVEFGGHGRLTADQAHTALKDDKGEYLSLYLPTRTALVLCREHHET
ncbi:MAG: alpha amylase C-terminal domain-containing protein [Thermodesulfobacteriota bacterium]|nr:alpha amylase C-terminal domain-containing protein [Thermodesulfobacteriota bacterium]